VTREDIGLAVFVAVVILDVAGLLLDFWLDRVGLVTITSLDATYPAIGWGILLLQVVGIFGLGVHFQKW